MSTMRRTAWFDQNTFVLAYLTCSLLVPGTWSQFIDPEPVVTVSTFTSQNGVQCVVESKDEVTLEALVNMNGVPSPGTWAANGIDFYSTQHPRSLCKASLKECPPSVETECFCKEYDTTAQTYTVVFKRKADRQLSKQSIFAQLALPQIRTVVTSEETTYPFVSTDIDVYMTYIGKTFAKRYSPPPNNSVLDLPGANQLLTLTIDGLTKPFSLTYIKLKAAVKLQIVYNQSSISIPVDESTRRVMFKYEEDLNCMRRADYIFSIDDGPGDSSDELSKGAIVGIVLGSLLFVLIVVLIIILCIIVSPDKNTKDVYKTTTSPEEPRAANLYSSNGFAAIQQPEEPVPRGIDNAAYFNEMAMSSKVAHSSNSVVKPSNAESGHKSLVEGEPVASPNQINLKDAPVKQGKGPYVSVIQTSLLY